MLDTVVADEERVGYAHSYFWATYVMIGGDASRKRRREASDPPVRSRNHDPGSSARRLIRCTRSWNRVSSRSEANQGLPAR